MMETIGDTMLTNPRFTPNRASTKEHNSDNNTEAINTNSTITPAPSGIFNLKLAI
jgi:hypothetical protein